MFESNDRFCGRARHIPDRGCGWGGGHPTDRNDLQYLFVLRIEKDRGFQGMKLDSIVECPLLLVQAYTDISNIIVTKRHF